MLKRILVRKKDLTLFFAMNAPFWVMYIFWPQALRLGVILLAFAALWSLFVARRERKHLWTAKMHDIWMCQVLWCVAAAEGNVEQFYRHNQPSLAVLLIVGVLMLTIKGVFNGEKYTIDQP